MIDRFDGEYAFLSNFYESPTKIGSYTYPTIEHAFQTAKTLNSTERRAIRSASTPAAAKKLGRKCTLRPDWEQKKVAIMTVLVREKFKQSPILTLKLKQTEPKELIEGNWWGDTFWGVCKGKGRNELGKILMDVRDTIHYPEPVKPLPPEIDAISIYR